MKKFKPVSEKVKGFLHGGDYNPDQWLDYPEILKEDVRLLKLAHCNCVSINIFGWSAIEPEEGVYTFEWLDKVMDAMANVIKHMDLMVIGPSEAGFGKINDQYRKVIYIKNKDYETLVKAKNRLEQWIDLNKIRKNLLVNFDFNPMNSY